MAKKYEVEYYTRTGTSDTVDNLNNVQKILFNETAGEIPLEHLSEGLTLTNENGELLMITSYDDNTDDTGSDEND